jgi:hypothetical protein
MSVKPNTDDPLDRARIELICLGRTLMPDEDSLERTIATLVLMLVWAVIVVAPMFAVVERPRYEIVVGITMVAFTILGKMWDFEVKRALNAVPLPDGGQTKDDSENNDQKE